MIPGKACSDPDWKVGWNENGSTNSQGQEAAGKIIQNSKLVATWILLVCNLNFNWRKAFHKIRTLYVKAYPDFSLHLNASTVWNLKSWTAVMRGVCSCFFELFRRSHLSEKDKQLSLEHVTQITAYVSTQKTRKDFLKIKNRCLEKPCQSTVALWLCSWGVLHIFRSISNFLLTCMPQKEYLWDCSEVSYPDTYRIPEVCEGYIINLRQSRHTRLLVKEAWILLKHLDIF